MLDSDENSLWRPMNDTRKFYGPYLDSNWPNQVSEFGVHTLGCCRKLGFLTRFIIWNALLSNPKYITTYYHSLSLDFGGQASHLCRSHGVMRFLLMAAFVLIPILSLESKINHSIFYIKLSHCKHVVLTLRKQHSWPSNYQIPWHLK